MDGPLHPRGWAAVLRSGAFLWQLRRWTSVPRTDLCSHTGRKAAVPSAAPSNLEISGRDLVPCASDVIKGRLDIWAEEPARSA